jgi:hypothetical protein
MARLLLFRAFCRGFREEFTGRAQRRRDWQLAAREVSDTVRANACLEMTQAIRRFYAERDCDGTPDYEHGYGDAVIDLTFLLEAQSKPVKDPHT